MDVTDYIYAILTLMGGVGAFLMGVKALSDNTEKLANTKIKKLFDKTSDKKLVGVGIGALTTAIVQSSGVTTVMVVGLVNAGIMTLFQATTIIMGANIGTTITAQIAALQAFRFSEFAMALTFIGIFMNMLSKNEKVKTVGYALAGLGLVFVGLNFMTSAMSSFKQSPAVESMLSNISNPFLLLFIGIIFTVLTQSSSAITSVVISMASAGLVIGGGGNAVLFIILGTNIGSCSTALISCIGAGKNAQRASLIHLMFNVFGSVLFFILLICYKGFMNDTFARWFTYESTQIAMFHTVFNVICTILFLPFCKLFVKISEKLIKDKDGVTEGNKFFDDRLLKTPGIALDAITKGTLQMLDMSVKSLDIALTGFIERDTNKTPEVMKINDEVGEMGREVTDYLIKISSQNIAASEEKTVSALHNNVGDIVRISELADNITKYTRREVKDGLEFSPYVNSKLREMYDKIRALADLTLMFVQTRQVLLIKDIDVAEDAIDLMRKNLIKDHIVRLNNGECRAENSSVFINLVCNMERVGDHITYIAHAFDEA